MRRMFTDKLICLDPSHQSQSVFYLAPQFPGSDLVTARPNESCSICAGDRVLWYSRLDQPSV
jgi:hypothetical protein